MFVCSTFEEWAGLSSRLLKAGAFRLEFASPPVLRGKWRDEAGGDWTGEIPDFARTMSGKGNSGEYLVAVPTEWSKQIP